MNHADTLRALYTEQPFLLAPMAGVTDGAYRLMCRSHGAKLAYSEMVSVAGLAYASEKTWELVLPAEGEPNIAVQLFGTKPEQFASAVEAVEERVGDKLTLIDINMACPVRKVISKGEGSALMQTPELAEEIVKACVSHAHVPVTVKMRKGFHSDNANAPEFAARMEQAGAAAVAVHGRFASQLYHGEADWDIISRVVEKVSVPVIGSGDVMSAQDAVRMVTTTGACAAFIARGTYGNPWIFDDALALLKDGVEPQEHSPAEKIAAFKKHLDLLHEHDCHMVRARSFANWYFKGLPGAASWRGRAVSCTTYEDFCELALAMEEQACERGLI